MIRHIALLLSLAVGLAGCGREPSDPAEKSASAILKLGGVVSRDKKLPGRPVVGVDLSGNKITDAGLKDLKDLTGLQWLDLTVNKISDAGLKDLKDLKGLQTLSLSFTQITDAGLKDL